MYCWQGSATEVASQMEGVHRGERHGQLVFHDRLDGLLLGVGGAFIATEIHDSATAGASPGEPAAARQTNVSPITFSKKALSANESKALRWYDSLVYVILARIGRTGRSATA
jgi:hypothetical protein